ncbi:MAG: type II toxin-antitoxin system VapC family toxin [Opitutales bacterium]
MEALIFDTCFLIDFQKERKRGPGRAHRFLQVNEEAYAYLPIVAYAEYGEGFQSLTNAAFLSVVESYELLEVTRDVADCYARLVRELRQAGQLIGTNDLWIAATALQHELPLVTRNTEHFVRIPEIKLLVY